MLDNFVLVHRQRQGEGDRPFGPEFAQGTLFETCMRRMVMTLESDATPIGNFSPDATDTIYRSQKAYQFLLEVVCGLRSPVKGETEVQGQFRDFLESLGETHELKSLMIDVLRDARKVRTEFLNGLGSQSYGSFARRRLREFQNIHVVGTGHLAEELFPWLAKISSKVHVYGRNVAKLELLKSRFPNFEIGTLHSTVATGGALVLAAPMEASEISAWFQPVLNQISLVLDYRAESNADGLKVPPSTVLLNLNDIFKELEQSRAKVSDCVQNASRYIQTLAENKIVCS